MSFSALEWRGITPDSHILIETEEDTHRIVAGLNTVPAEKLQDLHAHFLVVPAADVWHTMQDCGTTRNLWTADIPDDATQRGVEGFCYNKVVAHEQLPVIAATLQALNQMQNPAPIDDHLPESEDLMMACFVFGCERGMLYAPKTKRGDVEFTLSYLRHFNGLSNCIDMLPPEVCSNKDVAMLYLSDYPHYLDRFPLSIRDDREIAEMTLCESESWDEISERLRNDLSFAYKAVGICGHKIVPYFGEGVRNCPTWIQKVLQDDGYVLQHLSEDYRNNPFYVANAMHTTPEALEFADSKVKEDLVSLQHVVRHLGRDCTEAHKLAIFKHAAGDVKVNVMQMFPRTAAKLIDEGLAAMSTKRKRSEQ